MVRVGLLKAGFVGSVHASGVFRSELGTRDLAERYGARVVADPAVIIETDKIDAVIGAVSPDTHADLLNQAGEAATRSPHEHRPVKAEYTI